MSAALRSRPITTICYLHRFVASPAHISLASRLPTISHSQPAGFLLSDARFTSNCTLRPALRQFSSAKPLLQKETVTIHFTLPGDKRRSAKAKLGDNLLDVVLENQLDIDGYGACEGTLACSTCHLIFKPQDYGKLLNKPTDEELDMLDLAYGLQDTSRLGCQVIVTKEMDGWEIAVPSGVADARTV